MKIRLKRISYKKLKPLAQESYNFQKVSAVLADYGFTTIRLTDDWGGADFIAQHIDGKSFLKIQLKGRLSFYKKYKDKDIYICFPANNQWYVYPHDKVLQQVLKITKISKTISWSKRDGYSFPKIPKELNRLLEPYRIKPIE